MLLRRTTDLGICPAADCHISPPITENGVRESLMGEGSVCARSSGGAVYVSACEWWCGLCQRVQVVVEAVPG